MSILLPSKYETERIDVVFEFLGIMEWNETIVSSVLEVQVHTGTPDPNASQMIANAPAFTDTAVTQKVRAGVPGNVYRLLCLVTGSTGQLYELEGFLAVLPALSEVPGIPTDYLTTKPYPYQVVDYMALGFDVLSSTLRTQIQSYTMPPEKLGIAFTPLSGRLADTFQTYALRESLGISFIPMSGILKTVLWTGYNNEKMSVSFNPLSGELKTVLITTNRSETLGVSFAPLSGVLS